jgi:hypothetical protein
MASRSSSVGGLKLGTPGPPVSAWRGWLPIASLPVIVVLVVPSNWPRWAYMWTLAVAIFIGCKWLTWRRTLVTGVPWWRHAGYLLAWPGLDAASFLTARAVAVPAPREWAEALAKNVLGGVLFWRVARWAPADAPLLAGWIGMIGIALMLHFGVFHVLSCAWRWLGVDARRLMNHHLSCA